MVADPDDDAINIYHTVGCSATESDLRAELARQRSRAPAMQFATADVDYTRSIAGRPSMLSAFFSATYASRPVVRT